MLSEGERHQLLVEWNTLDGVAWPEPTLHNAFASMVARFPEALAVSDGSNALTYAQLDAESNRLAQYLIIYGCSAETRVAFALERGTQMIVTLLAILKAGGTYVPLDPSYPQERIAWMLEDSAAMMVVTETRHEDALPSLFHLQYLVLDVEDLSSYPETDPGLALHGANLAYLNYTSGTTGRPKAVQVSHANVLRLVGDRTYVDLVPGSAVGQVSNASFDALTFEVWTALTCGGRLVIVDRETLLDIPRFAKLIASESIKAMFLTVTFFNECVRQDPTMFQSMDFLLYGGERASAEHVATVLRQGPPRHLINGYGPTETTTFAVTYAATDLDVIRWNVPIGRPIADTPLYVVDRHLELVPLQAPGELMIAGAGLSRGYLNRPALTAEKFIPDPFAGHNEAGSRMYRSGDLVRWQAEGDTGVLVYLGRIGNQVKIRGFRIEPDEIASVLKGYPQIEDAVVLVEESATGQRLVAAFTYQQEAQYQPDELRAFLRPILPGYMMPSLFLHLDTLPRTPNGKVDNRAILEWARRTSQEDTSIQQAPETPEELRLQAIWMDLLGLPAQSIGRDGNFFVLGGHSLLATRLVSAIRKEMAVELPLPEVFAASTLSALANRIESLSGKGMVIQGPVPVERGQTLPLSFAQERLWFLYQLEGPSTTYSMPFTLTLQGKPLDLDALTACFQMLVNRHESLRTVFRSGDAPSQWIRPSSDFALTCHDLRDQPRAIAEAKTQALVRASEAAPFLLEKGPLLSAFVVLLGAEETVLHVNMHHIISDGWSVGVLVKELLASYEQRIHSNDVPLSPLAIQYADYAIWQKQLLSGPLYAEQLQFWRGALADAPTALDLPSKPRPSVQTFAGSTLRLPVPSELTARLEQLAQSWARPCSWCLRPGSPSCWRVMATPRTCSLARPSPTAATANWSR